MTASNANQYVASLPTGTLVLDADRGPEIERLCRVAARANPKRGFLIVSRILGRHLPARPTDMRSVMNQLAAAIPDVASGPIVILGMAETATALGQGVFAAYQVQHGDHPMIYLQTARQHVPGAVVLASFEEGHSHATTHLVQMIDDELLRVVRNARTLILVDDECSTGNTFVSAAEAMLAIMPQLEQIHTCCITDWSGGGYLKAMPVVTNSHALLEGRMRWSPATSATAVPLPIGANSAGAAPRTGMQSRVGIDRPEEAVRQRVRVTFGERILVLGDGEHSYEALLVAEDVEAAGGIAAVQCITRSPALLGHAMDSVSLFEDAYGSGTACYLYNMLAHQPDRILIVAEIEGNQVQDARIALHALGTDIPVELVLCRYGVLYQDASV